MKPDTTRRLAALEQARYERMTPLERAYDLVARKVPVDAWPDAELEAFCAERPEFDTLTDAELELLIADPWTDAARAIMTRLEALREQAGLGPVA